MIAFGIQLICIGLHKYKISTAKMILVCASCYVLSYAFPFFEHNPYESRVEVWQSALSAGFSHPLFGGGFATLKLIYIRQLYILVYRFNIIMLTALITFFWIGGYREESSV